MAVQRKGKDERRAGGHTGRGGFPGDQDLESRSQGDRGPTRAGTTPGGGSTGAASSGGRGGTTGGVGGNLMGQPAGRSAGEPAGQNAPGVQGIAEGMPEEQHHVIRRADHGRHSAHQDVKGPGPAGTGGTDLAPEEEPRSPDTGATFGADPNGRGVTGEQEPPLP